MQEYKLATSYEILQLVNYDRNNIHQTKNLIKSGLPPTKIQNESFFFLKKKKPIALYVVNLIS